MLGDPSLLLIPAFLLPGGCEARSGAPAVGSGAGGMKCRSGSGAGALEEQLGCVVRGAPAAWLLLEQLSLVLAGQISSPYPENKTNGSEMVSDLQEKATKCTTL